MKGLAFFLHFDSISDICFCKLNGLIIFNIKKKNWKRTMVQHVDTLIWLLDWWQASTPSISHRQAYVRLSGLMFAHLRCYSAQITYGEVVIEERNMPTTVKNTNGQLRSFLCHLMPIATAWSFKCICSSDLAFLVGEK